jgi:hypothetical protein
MNTKNTTPPKAKTDQLLLEQFQIEGYEKSADVDSAQLARNLWARIGKKIVTVWPLISHLAIIGLQASSRKLFNRGETIDEQITLQFLEGFEPRPVPKSCYQSLLLFGHRRAWDPKLRAHVDVLMMGADQAQRCAEYLKKHSQFEEQQSQYLLEYSKNLRKEGLL